MNKKKKYQEVILSQKQKLPKANACERVCKQPKKKKEGNPSNPATTVQLMFLVGYDVT